MIMPRHTGHPAAISASRIAQFSQKRACPHGTNANPSRGAIRHTSQNCDSVTADADDVAAVAVGAGAVGRKVCVCAPMECLTADRNCIRV